MGIALLIALRMVETYRSCGVNSSKSQLWLAFCRLQMRFLLWVLGRIGPWFQHERLKIDIARKTYAPRSKMWLASVLTGHTFLPTAVVMTVPA